MEDAQQLAQGAVEQLSEDESLRGDLTDDGFDPLLQWATNAAIAYATTLTNSSNADQAMQDYAAKLKAVIQAAVADAQAGSISDVAELTDFEATDKQQLQQQLAGLTLTSDVADDNATKIAEVLSAALPTNS